MKKISVSEHLKKKSSIYVIGIIFIIILNIIVVFIPKITASIIDGASNYSLNSQAILILCLKIIGLSLVSFAIGFFSRYIIINAALVFGENSRNKIFKYLVDLSMRYFSKNSVGEVMTLTTNDVKVVQHTIRMLIMAGSRVIFLIIMSFIAMTSVANFKLTIAAFAPFPLLTIFIIYYGKIIRKRFRIVQDSYANLARKTEDNIMSMKVVKAFCREDDEEIDFEKYNEQNFQANLSMIRSTAIYHPIIVLVASVSFMILIGMGGSMVIKGVITLGAYVASMQYVSNIIHPFVMVARLLENLQRARASMSRIDDFFVNSPDIHDNTNEAEFKKNVDIKDKLEGSIDFNHLSFSYQDDDKDINKVLDDITLRVNKGECLGIIGKIGSGKSTIVNLLLRLYDTEGDGMINIDGYDIKKIPLSLLRHSIGYVPQDNFLFSDTIENNINLGIDNDIDVTKYTEISQIHDSIMDLPEKYSTILGERGVNLSGGQKQRMSIARALVREPSILILDDCLSAVDTYTEKAILKRLRPFIKDRTTIIIAHRISALLNADKILVLDNGKMIQYGSHDELLKVEGIYKSIYDKQLLEDKIRSVKKEGE